MLDLTTLMLVLALTTATAVVCLLVAAALNPHIPAVRYWGAGLTIIVFGALLQSARAYLPLWISAVVITQGYFVLWWGARCYRAQGDPRGFWTTMGALLVVQGGAFYLLQDSLRFSIIAHSAAVVVVGVLMAVEVIRVGAPQRTLTYAWCGIWLMHAALYLRRLLLYSFDPAYASAVTFEQGEAVEALNYLEGIVFIYAFTMICIMFLLRSLQDELKTQAMHDPLTNLFNRRAFEEAALRQLSDNGRRGEPAVLMLLDLDRFKSLNDSHGHAVGDAVLTRFARVLLDGLRGQDLACRFGGEEFLLLISGADLPAAEQLAERIRAAWQQQSFTAGEEQVSSTVSIGCTPIPADSALSLHELVERADRALYQAKASGRNRCSSWVPESA
ncbi:MAG: GGDEF domain-containing protein [Pseudomonadaceae bacterium]